MPETSRASERTLSGPEGNGDVAMDELTTVREARFFEPLKAEDVLRPWWGDRMTKGLAAVIDKQWFSHENRHPQTNGEPHGWVSTFAGSGGARDIVFRWSGYKEKATADYIVALHNKALAEASLVADVDGAYAEPGTVEWYHRRLVEEREANRRLIEKNVDLEDNLNRFKSIAEELWPAPLPPADDQDV